MIDKIDLLRCKVALYEEFMNAEYGDEWSENEKQILYYLTLDDQIQDFFKELIKDEDENEQ